MEIEVFEFAAYKYEWIAIPHASEVENITEPNGCNVLFAVDILSYSNSSGEPLLYNGSVSCNEDIYTFMISPPPGNDTAVWYPQTPPADSSEDPYFNRSYVDEQHISQIPPIQSQPEI